MRPYSSYTNWQYRSGVSHENHQLQLIINAQKGVSLDFDAAGRDAKTQSKELYLWGQTQDDGIKGKSIMLDLDDCSGANCLYIECVDVTDRLAYLNYVQGALSYTVALEIDKCVPTLKIYSNPIIWVLINFLGVAVHGNTFAMQRLGSYPAVPSARISRTK